MLSASRIDRASWANASYDVAWRILHDRDAATAAAVHGVAVDAIADPASAMLIATRRRALSLLESRDGARPAIDESGGVAFVNESGSTADQVTAADHAWGAAEAMGPDEASLIDLHLRFGIPAGTLADDLDSDPDLAAEHLKRLRGRLEGALATWKLWNDGRPRCDDLTAELAELGPATFGPAAGRGIAKHAVGCELCRSVMADRGAGGLDAFVQAPVLRAPAAVHEAVPGTQSASVYTDTDLTTDATTVTPAVDAANADASPAERPETPASATTRNTDDDVDPDIGGPGLAAGIVLGIVLSIIIIAGITAWVITSA